MAIPMVARSWYNPAIAGGCSTWWQRRRTRVLLVWPVAMAAAQTDPSSSLLWLLATAATRSTGYCQRLMLRQLLVGSWWRWQSRVTHPSPSLQQHLVATAARQRLVVRHLMWLVAKAAALAVLLCRNNCGKPPHRGRCRPSCADQVSFARTALPTRAGAFFGRAMVVEKLPAYDSVRSWLTASQNEGVLKGPKKRGRASGRTWYHGTQCEY